MCFEHEESKLIVIWCSRAMCVIVCVCLCVIIDPLAISVLMHSNRKAWLVNSIYWISFKCASPRFFLSLSLLSFYLSLAHNMYGCAYLLCGTMLFKFVASIAVFFLTEYVYYFLSVFWIHLMCVGNASIRNLCQN